MTEAELAAKEVEARSRLPIKRILEQSGSGPRGQGETWKSFRCPFCAQKAATVFTANKGDAVELFKCFHNPCPADQKALNETTLLARLRGVSNKEGWKIWLQESGVWKEERLAPSVMPGSKKRRAHDPTAQVAKSSPEEPLSEAEIGEAIELVRAEDRAGTSFLQRRMRLGFVRASKLMEELERRGVVGPSKGDGEPRDVLPEKGTSREVAAEGAGHPGNKDFAGSVEETNSREVPPQAPVKPARTSNETPDNNQGEMANEANASQPETSEASAAGSEDGAANTAPNAAHNSVPGKTPQNPPQSSTGAPASDGGEPPSFSPGDGKIVEGLFRGGGGGGGGGNGGGGRGGRGGGGEGGDDGSRALSALLDFYDRLNLCAEDELKLARERGLTRETCRRLGFRSNYKENREILFELEKEYPSRILRKAGLWVWDGQVERDKPNAQLSGWGVVGKKPKAKAREESADIQDTAEARESDLEWGWTNPVIIPYVGVAGDVFHLRPHKGQRKGQNNRFYVVRPVGEPENWKSEGRPEYAVITEGEFKAAALWQVFRGEIAVGALPGISNGKNEAMRSEVKFWLQRVRPKRVIIAYDNEEKGDPKYAGSYKEDPAKRYDTQVWARVLAKWLESQGFSVGVAWLPNAWRDEKGKADWDGVLSRRIRGEKAKLARGKAATLESETEVLEKTYERIADTIRKEWTGVFEAASEPDMDEALFQDQVERIIRNKVTRLLHEPMLPYGGDKEEDLARIFFRLSKDQDFDFHTRAGFFADRFRKVIGWYYIREPLKMSDKEKLRYEALREQAEVEAQATGNFDRFKFFTEALNGVPKGVGDFKIDCKFVLVKPNGERERVTTIFSRHAPTARRVKLDSKSMTAPRDFRLWLANKGNFDWLAGERELQALMYDLNHLSAHMNVYEVPFFGWYHDEDRQGMGGTDSRLWFADDCAITPEGKFLIPDKEGVVWWGGLGYLMSETDWEGGTFTQKRPKWHPEMGLQMDIRIGKGEEEPAYKLVEGADDEGAIQDLFQNVSFRIYETLGTKGDGYLTLGAVLAFGAAPEFIELEKWFSGLWLHGERGGGKSTLASWLMGMWGFNMEAGPKLTTSTVVGMRILAQQYSNLPIWIEEYQSGMDESKEEYVKSLYNREPSLKMEMGGRRKIRTNAIITGEATSSNSATHQRFPHVQVSKKAREEMEERTSRSHKRWFQENSRFFFCLGRFVLLRRKKFVELFFKHHREWCASPELRRAEERSKQVHGVGYAGFLAMAELLGSHAPADLEEFKHELLRTTHQAVQDVRDEVNINQFWHVLNEAWKLGVFGKDDEARRYFRTTAAVADGGAPPDAPNQKPGMGDGWANVKAWKTYRLYIDYNAVIPKLQEHLTRRREELSLAKRDLRDQMSKEGYWVPAKTRDGHKYRMGGSTAPSRVWVINLDKHPMGYQRVTDEELLEARREKPSDEGFDPRLGELHAIALAVEEGVKEGVFGGQ